MGMVLKGREGGGLEEQNTQEREGRIGENLTCDMQWSTALCTGREGMEGIWMGY